MNKQILSIFFAMVLSIFLVSCSAKKEACKQNKTETNISETEEKSSEINNSETKEMATNTISESENKSEGLTKEASTFKTNADTKIRKETNAISDSVKTKSEDKIGEERKLVGTKTNTEKQENVGLGPAPKQQDNNGIINPDSEPIIPKKPPVIIYKTKADYSNNIPVILSADKKMVVRYPAPGDIFFEGKISRPTKLANGFYLDNRGVNENVAFTSYTYDNYLNLKKPPTAEELFNIIIDANPLLEIYQLNDIGRDEVELNKPIKAGNLPKNFAK